MVRWEVDRIINFGPGDFCKNGLAHFGFHDDSGGYYAISHQRHFLGFIDEHAELKWTLANHSVFEGVPNIFAELRFPMYVSAMSDGTLVASNFGNGKIYRIDPKRMTSRIFVEGNAIGMKDVGNCVVDDEGFVWVNEVTGCRVWKFDSRGRAAAKLGEGKPGFNSDTTDFDEAKFNWIYDIRKGPDGNIYVLDSRNFAVRMIDIANGEVLLLAGTGKPGYGGDGGPARLASFGSDPNAKFDGPISMSLDESGNIFIGDRFNQVVRMIHKETGCIETIAGKHGSDSDEKNIPSETDPLKLSLPKISSMDYHNRRLLVPTDLSSDMGDLIVLKKR